MGRLPVLSGRDVVAALRKAGFQVVGRRGSHVRLKALVDTNVRIVVVPMHDELAPGTRASIIRQSGLGRARFLALLE